MNEFLESRIVEAYKKYERLLLKESFAILGDYDLAEDCCQEAFIALQTRLQNAEDTEVNIQAFLIKTVRNVSLYCRRRQGREQLLPESDDKSFEVPDYEVEDERRRWENIEAVEQTIRNLPLHNWQVVRLKYEMGLKDDEISLRLGLSCNAVRKLLKETMGIIKQQL